MAVTLQATANSVPDTTTETTLTLALNAGSASNRLILVTTMGNQNSDISTKTYGGVAMTFVDSIRTEAAGGNYLNLYKLVGDANVASGSNNIVINQTSNTLYVAAYAFSGASDIANTTKGNSVGDNTITRTVTSNGADGFIVASANTNYGAPGAFTDTTGQTDVYAVTAAVNAGGGVSGYQAAGSGASTVFTWTSAHAPAVNWGMIATNVQASTASAVNSSFFMFMPN